MCEVDLSRVILNDRTEWEISPTLQKYLDQGMRLMCLELLNPDSLDDQQLSSKSFPGLTEIQIHTDTIKPISFSWLSELSSTHSTLNELWLLDGCGNYFPRHIPPFVSPFIDQGKDLKNLYAIQNVGYRRAIGQSSQEWYVMGLALRTIWAGLSPIKALELVASSFPKLEKLALNLSCDAREAMYDILSSLRVVHLDCIYKRLIFGSEDEKHISLAREVQGDSVTFDLLVDRVERALLLFASRLAEHVRSLDFVYIHDMGFDYDKSGTLRYNWYLTMTSEREVREKPIKEISLRVLLRPSRLEIVIMRPQFSLLPNELLQSILEYIAYSPILGTASLAASPTQINTKVSLYKCASPELIALSVVDWRLRRLCLPSLFANIELKEQMHVKMLKKHLALFSSFIKILFINSFCILYGIQEVIPQLKELFHVELARSYAGNLLRTILAHPTVTSVLIHELPHESMCDHDLSKVLLKSGRVFDDCIDEGFTFDDYLNQGMRLVCLNLHDYKSLDDQLSGKVLPGLKEIRIIPKARPPQKIYKHPARWSPSSFWSIFAGVGDLGSVLARFSSLQVLYLEYAFEQLEFGSGDKMPLVQRTDHTGSAFDGLSRAESGLLLFASRLAKQIQTLDLIYIHEDGYDLPAKFGFLKDGFMYSIAIGMSVEHPNGVFIPDDEFLSEDLPQRCV
ncbi:hypothetical protein EV360DRAFT_67192 [Lentinula raphanica]|nr:hypothetical protein EV360DRAFT_67192 [Lentinula raphanica]